MRPPSCPKIRKQLHLFLDGELRGSLQEQVQAHLEKCPDCAHELHHLAQLMTALDETITPEATSPEWVAEVQQAVRQRGPLTDWRGRLMQATRGDLVRLYLEIALAVLMVGLGIIHPWNPTVSPIELQVINLGQWLCGSTTALRVLARNTETNEPLRNARVNIWLTGDYRHTLYTGRTNERGTVDSRFPIPRRFSPGTYHLTVETRSPQGVERLSQTVELVRAHHLKLSTDRVYYRPGQTIYLRVWVREEGTRRPAVGQTARLEVRDPRGNVIWQKEQLVSEYGVAAEACALDRTVLCGRYTVRARVAGNAAQSTVWVQPYTRAKFRLRILPERPFYAPGEVLQGRIEARYFFGPPVPEGIVHLAIFPPSLEAPALSRWDGVTDANGVAPWRYRLPHDLLANQPAEAVLRLRLVATVQDNAGQMQTVQQTVAVARSPILLEVVPESGTLVPGVENILYLLARYPHGAPAEVELEVTPTGSRPWATVVLHSTAGVAQYHLKPGPGQEALMLTARDREGRQAVLVRSLKDLWGTEDQLLLRPDRAFYRAGDTVQVTVLTPQPGAVYLDLLQAHRTILTESLDVNNGRGSIAFALPPDVEGPLWLHGYHLTAQGVLQDMVLLYVASAPELHVSLAPDQKEYRPRQQATVQVSVRDDNGRPVPAALGLTIVGGRGEDGPGNAPNPEGFIFPPGSDLGNPPLNSPWEPLLNLLAPSSFQPSLASDAVRQRVGRALVALQSPTSFGAMHRGDNTRAKVVRAERIRTRFWHLLRTYGLGIGGMAGGGLFLLLAIRLALRLEPWLFRPTWNDWNKSTRTGFPHGPHRRRIILLSSLGLGSLVLGILIFLPGRISLWRTGSSSRLSLLTVASSPRRTTVPEPSEEYRVRRPESEAPGVGALSPAGAPGPLHPAELELPASIPPGSDFSQTLWVAPELITDRRGQRRVPIPLADTLTTWRMTAFVSSRSGKWGVATSDLRVAQDFFLDLDLPSQLTLGDEIALPVILCNYRDQTQTIRLTVRCSENRSTLPGAQPGKEKPGDPAPWCAFLESPSRAVTLAPQEVAMEYFWIRAEQSGTHSLTVSAYNSATRDTLQRETVVQPRGRVFSKAFNGRLGGSVTRTITLPRPAVSGTSRIRIKVYPDLLSQILESLDSFQLPPAANLEQVASAIQARASLLKAWPHSSGWPAEVRKQVAQELHLRYQQFLTFEAVDKEGGPTGGFSESVAGPPRPWLTALGLRMLTDLSSCQPVEPAIIRRLCRWLLRQQEEDYTWAPEEEPAINWREGRDSRLATTAYITGALVQVAPRSPGVQRALRYLGEHLAEANDHYTLALCAQTLVLADPSGAATQQALQRLVNFSLSQDDQIYWTCHQTALTHAQGAAADLETTALATLTLLQAGAYREVVRGALAYLLDRRQPDGGWGSSQADSLCLQALLRSLDLQSPAAARGRLKISVNGHEGKTLRLTRRGMGRFQEVDVSPQVSPGHNRVRLAFRGSGQLSYQIVLSYQRPWSQPPPQTPSSLGLTVAYKPHRLTPHQPGTCHIAVRNSGREEAHEVRIEVGLPPGFHLDPASLKQIIPKPVGRFAVEDRQLILTLAQLRPGQEQTLDFPVRPSFPLRTRTPPARVLETYTPQRVAYAAPTTVTVE